MAQIGLHALNRTTLHRQGLLERFRGPVPEVVGRLAGLQAQHADQPYIALWSRRADHTVADLEQALGDRTVVKATLLRTTLHLVPAADYRAYDVVSAGPRVATWRPTARRAGVDLAALGREVRAFCSEPRTVAEIEAHLTGLHPDVDLAAAAPGGVRNAWFRPATATGGLVHVPPSGMWRSHGKPRYLDATLWLGDADREPPDLATALVTVLRRYLTAYGPAPPRFLSRWDSLIIGYAARERILPPEHTPAVAKKNGDFLPTFLLDGFVAGLWSVDRAGDTAVLRLQPFATPSRQQRAALEEEAERLVRFVEPDAARHEVAWAD